MGKNKIRSKDKSRKDKTSISDTTGSSTPSTWTSAHGAVITRSTSNTSDRRQLPSEPPEKTLCVATITSLKDTTTSKSSSASSPTPPITRGKGTKDKRDSVISSTWEGPKQQSEPKATTAARPRWGFRPRNWWPCRIIRRIYRFFVALTRIRWTDKQTSKDLILTLTFIGIVVAGGYVALDILLKAIPGVSAQARVVYFRFHAIHDSVAVYDLYAFECNHLISRLIKHSPGSELQYTPKHAWRTIFGASNRFECTDDF
ncbi:hypothetical protein J4E93_006434 [Alternaria ventricosa]|uniref:uncharacterized protein n=1 Tax=Alternaria ventricosa TaxID=1187951 RepID=UPI0020C50208|nr:uncharacterized protein J4E93_006434 [Alternaria ventricosa]KAI4644529.1 hypothetical protein J4E93_006434 [Alternaria ventricosa]